MGRLTPQIGEFGLQSTGSEAVDRKVVEIVSDSGTQLIPRLGSIHVLGRDVYFGQTTYERGELPFVQTVSVDAAGTVEELVIAQSASRELPEGFREKAARLEEDTFLSEPPETFPDITGWQLLMAWGYFHMDAYRAQRVEALYANAGLKDVAAIRRALRHDPIVVISPVVSPRNKASTHSAAQEMFGMFGRYNKGSIVPASVDFEAYPYMEERSFEDASLMQAILDDMLHGQTE